ncbi:MAG: hypothetical protein Q9174_004656 [Haloplaca sp. 1 TL-2023]
MAPPRPSPAKAAGPDPQHWTPPAPAISPSPPPIEAPAAPPRPLPAKAPPAPPQQPPQQVPAPATPPAPRGFPYLQDDAVHLDVVRADAKTRTIRAVQNEVNDWADRARGSIPCHDVAEARRMAAHLQQCVEEMLRERAEKAASTRMGRR